MTEPWTAKYTDEQRDAVGVAVTDRGLSAPEVVRRAAAGELRPGLAPFTMPVGTVRDLKRKVLQRRQGDIKSGITDVPHHEAVDTLRKRLLSAAELELAWVERLQRRAARLPRPHEGEEPESGRIEDDAAAARRADRLRQVARAVREAAAIAVPTTNRQPTKPGAHDPDTGATAGSRSTDGPKTLAGGILAAHVADRVPAPADPEPATDDLPPLPDANGQTNTDRPDRDDTTTPGQHTADRGGAASVQVVAAMEAGMRARLG